MTAKLLKCSFCGKDQNAVELLMAKDKRSKTLICDECVLLCNDILIRRYRGLDKNDSPGNKKVKHEGD